MVPPRSHKTPFDEANQMINNFLEIREYISKNLPEQEGVEAETARKYVSPEVVSFAFYKKELDEYFDKLEKENPIDPIQPEQFGIRIYLAADETGKPSLVVTLCKLIGTGTDVKNMVTAAAGGVVVQHPRVAGSSGRIYVESGDQRTCLP